jgi:hypothetical protein
MIYMVSQSIGDGTPTIDAVFKPGTDVDQAQAWCEPRVGRPASPDQVRNWRDGAQEVARLMLVISDLSRWDPRPAIHLQLRDH